MVCVCVCVFPGFIHMAVWHIYWVLGLSCLEWQELVPDKVCAWGKLDWATFMHVVRMLAVVPYMECGWGCQW